MLKVNCGFVDQFQLIKFGPTLAVQIGFDAEYDPSQPIRPILPQQEYPALVDTGASISCIDSTLAQQLKLPIINRRVMAGVHGASQANMHLAQVYLPVIKSTIWGEFVGVHLIAGGQPHFALIGRTFLAGCTMSYEGKTGSVVLSV